jgi:frataxin-like iron-binding protein CyaY
MGQIRTLQTDYLRKGAEQITYKVFEPDGTYKTTEDENILFNCPTEIRPLNQDLTRQYERPLKQVEFVTPIRGNYIKNENAHFLFGDHRWSLQDASTVTGKVGSGSRIAIDPDTDLKGKAVSGNKYARCTVLTQNATPTQFIATERQYTKLSVDTEIKIEFDYYIETTGSNEKYQIAIKAFSQETYNASSSSGTPYHYDFENDQWSSGSDASKFKNFETTTVNAWGKASVTLKPYATVYPNARPSVDEIFLNAIICIPNKGSSAGGFQNLFVDNFRVQEDHSVENKIISRRKQYDQNGTYTAKYEFNENVLSNEAKTTEYFIGKIEGNFKRPRDTVNKTLEQMITHDIINDSRDFLRRYEGTFRSLNERFLGMHHKVWIDFGDEVLQEPVSCYIDAMKFDVKKAEYQLRMHLPNQDDDTGTTYNVHIE